MSDWRAGVSLERDELITKIGRLSVFVEREGAPGVTTIQRLLLTEQLRLMREYCDVLKMRLVE